MNLDPADKNYDSHMQDTVNILHPDYNPNTQIFDFIYQGTRFVRIVSPNPNFISDFYTLSANMPSMELKGFEITINRTTNVEVHGDLENFHIGQLSEPILVSE